MNLSVPQFPYLGNGGNDGASIIWADVRLNELINGKYWEELSAYKGPAGDQGWVVHCSDPQLPQMHCGQCETSPAGAFVNIQPHPIDMHVPGLLPGRLGFSHGVGTVVGDTEKV